MTSVLSAISICVVPRFHSFWKVGALGPGMAFTGMVWGAIHSTKVSGNFGPKLNGSVRSNRKSFEKTGPPFEVVLFSRSDRSECWLNGSRPWFLTYPNSKQSMACETDLIRQAKFVCSLEKHEKSNDYNLIFLNCMNQCLLATCCH